MHYLVLAVLSSFSISILIKIFEQKKTNTLIYLASNYLSAGLLGWTLYFLSGSHPVSQRTLLLGLAGGVMWPSTFFMLMWGIRTFGISLTGAVARLSLVVPVLFAVAFLGEILTKNILAGIFIAVTAFFMLNPAKRNGRAGLNRHALWFFPLLVLFFGIVDVWVNVFNTFGNEAEKYMFILLIFTFSGIITWLLIAFRRIKPDSRSVKSGLILGIPNYFSSFFLMESLKSSFFLGKSAVVFSLYSTLGIILAFLAGIIFWKEPVAKTNIAGAVLAVAAVILLNTG